MSKSSATPISAAELSAQLASRIEELAGTLLPAAIKVSGTLAVGSIRGEPGQSLRIFRRGSRRGHWKDFAGGEAGDALDLVAQCLFHGDLKRAYAWAVDWLGGAPAPPLPTQRPRLESARSHRDDDECSRRAAAAIWRGTVAAPGTLTDLYLRDRGIRCAIPPAIRHHPALAYWNEGRCYGKYPAVVAAVTDLCTGRFLAVHRVYLDGSIDAGPARKAVILDSEGRTLRAKKSLGATKGGAVVLGDHRVTGPLYVAEGLETILSAVSLTGCPGIATLGAWNMPEVELPPHLRDIVIVPDPDRPGIRAATAAARRWAGEGRRVCIAGTAGASDAA
jgi:Toprim domain